MVKLHSHNRGKRPNHSLSALNKKDTGGVMSNVTLPAAGISKSTKASTSQTAASSSSIFSFQCRLPTMAQSASTRCSSGADVTEQAQLSASLSHATVMAPSDTRRISIYARRPSSTPSTSSATTLGGAPRASFSAHSPSPAPSTSSSTTYVSGSASPSNTAAASVETIKRLRGRHIQVTFPCEHAEYLAPHVSLPGMPLSHTLSHTSPCLFQTALSHWVPFCTYAETRGAWYLFVSTVRSMMSDSFKSVPNKYRVWVADKLVSPGAYTMYLEVYGLSVPQGYSPFKAFYCVLRTIMRAHGRDAMYRWVYTFVRYLATQELHRLRVLRNLPEDLLAQVLVPMPEGWAPPVECMMLELDRPFIMGPMTASERHKLMCGRAPYLYRYKYFIGVDVSDSGID